MPGALLRWNKLNYSAIPTDKKMSGDLEAAKRLIIRVSLRIQPVGKELYHTVAAEIIWRKADIVDNKQGYRTASRTFVKIGRRDKTNVGQAFRCF